MKYAVISDIHSNLEAFNAVIKEAEKENVEAYVCTGDLIGYGPDPVACISLFRSLPFVAYIGGNHENTLLSSDKSDMNKIAMSAIRYTDKCLSEEDKKWIYSTANWTKEFESKIFAAHGSLYAPETFPYLSVYQYDRKMCFAAMEKNNCDTLFVGHTHSPSLMVEDAYSTYHMYPVRVGVETIDISKISPCIIDVGSVGQPRDNDVRASFAIYDTDTNIVTRHRVEYDFEKTANKIIAAGLPDILALRLKFGK